MNTTNFEFEWTSDNIDTFVKKVFSLSSINNSNKNNKAYSIFIDGKRFTTEKGRAVWKQKNHVSAAFRNSVEYLAKYIVKDNYNKANIDSHNIDSYSIYRMQEYRNAFENVRDELIKSGRLEIRELDFDI